MHSGSSPSPRPPQHVNPFYIESRAQWEGDWNDDDEDEDEDLEEEGLLGYDLTTPHSGRPPPPRYPFQHRSLHDRNSRLSPRVCVAFTIAFAIAFVVLSLSGSSERASSSPSSSTTTGSSTSTSSTSGSSPLNEKETAPFRHTVKPPPDQQQQQRQIIVLGERHSGVPWLVDKLSKCFINVTVQSGFSREGYWFQDEKVSPPHNSTILVYAVRHPFAWVDMMRQLPFHTPGHWNVTSHAALSWKDFLQREWSTERPPQDYQQAPSQSCQLGFRYNQIISCHSLGGIYNITSNPIYELQPDGTPYSGILPFRAAKINHVLNLPDHWKQGLIQFPDDDHDSSKIVGDDEGDDDEEEEDEDDPVVDNRRIILVVQYEDPRLLSVVQRIQMRTGWKLTCRDDGTLLQQTKPNAFRSPLSEEYKAAMTAQIDWETESKIGYAQDSPWN